MAVRHHAYGFDPSAYLAAMTQCCVVGGVPRPEALRVEAEAIVARATGPSRDVLEYLRYDEEWLHPTTAEPAWREWLVCSLVPHLTPLPSLSNREPHSFFVLEKVLPIAGWRKADVDLLILGRSLDTLPELLAAEPLKPLFHHMRQYGGWVEAASVSRLRLELERVRAHFFSPGMAERQGVEEWLRARSRLPEQVLPASFTDAMDMLEGAGTEGRALFMLFE